MLDVQEQLGRLRKRVAAIDRKYQNPKRTAVGRAPGRDLSAAFVEEWAEGQVVSNSEGQHFQMERTYPPHKQHGSADIGALCELPADFLDALSAREITNVPAERWAFLDTETTGLLGNPGIYAFLIGVGRITAQGFVVRQYFMRQYAEERSMLLALEEHLADFDVLVTYNGRSYDEPLLEARYHLHHRPSALARLAHLDLLHGSRRLWQLAFDNCRLMQLEQEILGVCREGDLPGELIPYVYFEYLRSREAQRMVPIFHHNAIDIVTLACLTAIVPAAFRTPDPDSLARVGVRRGTELAGIARWLRAAGEHEKALALFRRAVQADLPDFLLFRTLWDIGCLEKKLGRALAARHVFLDLAGCRNDYRVQALEELAKSSEREDRNFAAALEFTSRALELAVTEALLRRKQRLERRLTKKPKRR